jgi:Ribbon-helix-helix protein, copG family
VRTTVTLDPDVAAKLRADARERGVSFKEAINGNLRRGLESADIEPTRFRVRPRPMGVKPGLDLDKARALADRLEDEEVLRKISLRK